MQGFVSTFLRDRDELPYSCLLNFLVHNLLTCKQKKVFTLHLYLDMGFFQNKVEIFSEVLAEILEAAIESAASKRSKKQWIITLWRYKKRAKWKQCILVVLQSDQKDRLRRRRPISLIANSTFLKSYYYKNQPLDR